MRNLMALLWQRGRSTCLVSFASLAQTLGFAPSKAADKLLSKGQALQERDLVVMALLLVKHEGIGTPAQLSCTGMHLLLFVRWGTVQQLIPYIDWGTTVHNFCPTRRQQHATATSFDLRSSAARN